jgi:LmbE family N-acetylglucosaminyl deacetylase
MVALAGAGNDAEGWHAWGGLDQLRPAFWGPPGRIVVVSAHRGDELLGLGGTLQTLVAAGHDVTIVTVGSGREPGAGTLDDLGVGTITHVSLPVDGPDDDTTATATALAEQLVGASWCVTPWRHDGDREHERAGAVAAKAAAKAGVALAEYLVRTWDWALPGDDRVPWEDARRSAFDHRVLARKELAISRAAGLSPELRSNLLRSFEVVLQPGLEPVRPFLLDLD